MTDTTATENQAIIPAEPHIRFYRDYRVYASWIVAIFFLFDAGNKPMIWAYIGSSIFFEWLIFDLIGAKESDRLKAFHLNSYNGFPPEVFDRYATFSKWARRGCFLFACIFSVFLMNHKSTLNHYGLSFLFSYVASFSLLTYAVTHWKVVVCPFKPKIRFMREYPEGYVPPPNHDFPEFDPLAKYDTIYGYYENYCRREISRGY